MALEIFGLLTKEGDSAQSDHFFVGNTADIGSVAEILDEIVATNKRLRSIATLACRFREASQGIMPSIRLNKQECRLLTDTLDEYAKTKPRTTKARKLRDHLCNALCVY